MAVEGLERRLESGWQLEGIQDGPLAAALLGHVLADVLPEVAEHGNFAVGDVVVDGDPRQLDDAALDGIHEGKITHGPGKQGALGIARPAQEEGGGRQVDDTGHPKLPVHGLDAGDPEPGGLVVLFGFGLLVACEVLSLRDPRFLSVAVVCLVVDDQDVLEAHEVGHHPLDHLAFGFQGAEGLPRASLEEGSPAL